MHLDLIGLGRISPHLGRRRIKASHECAVFDAHATAERGTLPCRPSGAGQSVMMVRRRIGHGTMAARADKLLAPMHDQVGGGQERAPAGPGRT